MLWAAVLFHFRSGQDSGEIVAPHCLLRHTSRRRYRLQATDFFKELNQTLDPPVKVRDVELLVRRVQPIVR